MVVASLDAADRQRAWIAGTFSDVLVGPGQDGNFPSEPQGILVSELDSSQRARVVSAVRAWTADTHESVGRALTRTYTAELSQTRVAWGGSADPRDVGAYVRIDGPRLWIEFSVQSQIGSGDEIHYHSVYRDKRLDYRPL